MLGDARGKPRGLHNYDAKALSDATALHGVDEGLVQQQFKNDVDVNTIMRRFGISGAMPFGSAQGVYGDFSGIEDYEGAIRKIEEAEKKFMALPPEVRERFDNNPGVLIQRARELDEERFLGLFGEDKPAEPANGS